MHIYYYISAILRPVLLDDGCTWCWLRSCPVFDCKHDPSRCFPQSPHDCDVRCNVLGMLLSWTRLCYSSEWFYLYLF